MPTLSELIAATSDATQLPVHLVSYYARRLIDAGLLPKSSGRRYAETSPRHVAMLLIALWATDKPTEGPAAVRALTAPENLPEEFRLVQGGLDRLTQLLEAATDLDLKIWKMLHTNCEINFFIKPLHGMQIDWGSGPKEHFLVDDVDVELLSRRIVESRMQGDILCHIGAFLAGKDYLEIFSQVRDDIPSQPYIQRPVNEAS